MSTIVQMPRRPGKATMMQRIQEAKEARAYHGPSVYDIQPTIIALAVNGACQIIGQLYHKRIGLERMAAAGKLDLYLPKGVQ